MSARRLLVAAVVLAGCQTPDAATSPADLPAAAVAAAAPHHGEWHPIPDAAIPTDQLLQVRQVTARYRDLAQAVRDGYVDIDVVLPNMGRHFLRQDILDDRFELERPELLVYQPREDGHQELVAVEYAVPLSLAATAPEGFRGQADQWSANQRFQLWTLHAWIWKDNPDGVFSPTNQLVP